MEYCNKEVNMDYLTTSEMAKKLGVSERRVRFLALKRGVGENKSTRQWIFSPDDIEKLRPKRKQNQ
jgi:DNA-binding transcriptional MerR regulator